MAPKGYTQPLDHRFESPDIHKVELEVIEYLQVGEIEKMRLRCGVEPSEQSCGRIKRSIWWNHRQRNRRIEQNLRICMLPVFDRTRAASRMRDKRLVPVALGTPQSI